MSGGAAQAVFFGTKPSESQLAITDLNASALRRRGHEDRVRWRASRRPEWKIRPQPRLSRGPVVLAAAMWATGLETDIRKGTETDFVSFNSHGKIQPRSVTFYDNGTHSDSPKAHCGTASFDITASG
jgi:hypothetical protein